MDESTAAFWLQVITGIMAFVWLCAAVFTARSSSLCAEPLRGEAEVPTAPAATATRFARAIIDARASFQGALIDSADEHMVRWHSPVVFKHRGEFTVTGDAKRSQAVWEITFPLGLVLAARLLVALGVAAVVGLYYLLHEYVLGSANPAVRAQVFQMFQAVHFLWPPFLLAGLARRQRTLVGNEVRRVVQGMQF